MSAVTVTTGARLLGGEREAHLQRPWNAPCRHGERTYAAEETGRCPEFESWLWPLTPFASLSPSIPINKIAVRTSPVDG